MFENKKIWIIGGTSGIGEALVKELESAGAKVIVSGRTSQNYSLDVNNLAEIKNAKEKILNDFGEIDMMIFASGVYTPMTSDNIKIEEALKIIRTNFEGAVNVLSEIIPYFIEKKSGHIAIVSSIAGYFGLPNAFGYSASKAALTNLCESLKIELTKHNIKVQLISPGFVKTRLTAGNKFPMPFIIDADKAANIIKKGLNSNKFEIHFPKIFTSWFKLLQILPKKLRIFLLSKI